MYEELPLAQPLSVMTGPVGSDNQELAAALPILTPDELPACEDRRSPYQDPSVITYTNDASYQPAMPYEKVAAATDHKVTFQDVLDGKASREELLSQLSEDQLADFCCGTGWGVEDDANPVIGGSSESVPGAAGETTHALEKEFGIPSIVMADGPGGVRLTQHFTAKNIETGEDQEVFHHCIAWPVGTLIAQSFDEKVAFEVGLGMKEDLKAFRIGILLGPGINIHLPGFVDGSDLIQFFYALLMKETPDISILSTQKNAVILSGFNVFLKAYYRSSPSVVVDEKRIEQQQHVSGKQQHSFGNPAGHRAHRNQKFIEQCTASSVGQFMRHGTEQLSERAVLRNSLAVSSRMDG